MKCNLNHLLNEGLLAKIPKSKEKADGSIKAAKEWLAEANNNFSNKLHKSSVLTAYLGMFHSARAILYLDGFREKSHFAVARYLEAVYVTAKKLEKEWVELLDYCRELRHNDQYRTSFFVSAEEAEDYVKKAESFVKRIEKLIEEVRENGK
ncbi:MAG: HEPN domain-containing protein [archaeon]